jgi:hypothetical protein
MSTKNTEGSRFERGFVEYQPEQVLRRNQTIDLEGDQESPSSSKTMISKVFDLTKLNFQKLGTFFRPESVSKDTSSPEMNAAKTDRTHHLNL